jgi:hypothetical protein
MLLRISWCAVMMMMVMDDDGRGDIRSRVVVVYVVYMVYVLGAGSVAYHMQVCVRAVTSDRNKSGVSAAGSC